MIVWLTLRAAFGEKTYMHPNTVHPRAAKKAKVRKKLNRKDVNGSIGVHLVEGVAVGAVCKFYATGITVDRHSAESCRRLPQNVVIHEYLPPVLEGHQSGSRGVFHFPHHSPTRPQRPDHTRDALRSTW